MHLFTVLLLLDWENILYSLLDLGPEAFRLDERIKKLHQWIYEEIGRLLGGKGFLFSPGHLGPYDYNIARENNLQIMVCPKDELLPGETKKKDNVDAGLIWFGQMMLDHPAIDILVVVSGDKGFATLLQAAHTNNIKVGLVAPTLHSLSASGETTRFIDNHPETGKQMFLCLEDVLEDTVTFM